MWLVDPKPIGISDVRDPAALMHCPECDDPFYLDGFDGKPTCFNHEGFYVISDRGAIRKVEVGVDE